jgi:hypothetical protein
MLLISCAFAGLLVGAPSSRSSTQPWMCAAPEENTPDPPERLSSLAALAATEQEAGGEAAQDGSPTTVQPMAPAASAACAAVQTPSERRRSLILGLAAPLAAGSLYTFQRLNPVKPIALLQRMEERSPTLPDALATGRPTLLEFYVRGRRCNRTSRPAPSICALALRLLRIAHCPSLRLTLSRSTLMIRAGAVVRVVQGIRPCDDAPRGSLR